MVATNGRDETPDQLVPCGRSGTPSKRTSLDGTARRGYRTETGGLEEAWILTPEQDARAVRALAVFKAKRDAFLAGVSLEQLDADIWVVDVDAVHAEVA